MPLQTARKTNSTFIILIFGSQWPSTNSINLLQWFFCPKLHANSIAVLEWCFLLVGKQGTSPTLVPFTTPYGIQETVKAV